jgi:hypothetical protein
MQGTYASVTTQSVCHQCVPLHFQNDTAQDSCLECPARMESDAGSALCRCSPGYYGEEHGPCSCERGSNRFLDVRIDDSFLNATGMVNVSVYNISSGNESACGEDGAGCVPFVIFYTLDGSVPTRNSAPACGAGVCTSQASYSISIQGAVFLRALALRQGSHPDACVAFGDNVSMYQRAPGAYPASHIAGICVREGIWIHVCPYVLP